MLALIYVLVAGPMAFAEPAKPTVHAESDIEALPSYTVSLSSGANSELKVGGEFWFPAGEGTDNEVFLKPMATFKGSDGVVNIPLLGGAPAGSSVELTVGAFRRHEPTDNDKDHASRDLPRVMGALTGGLSTEAFSWRELDEQTTPATLGDAQSARHPSANGALHLTFVPAGSDSFLEVGGDVKRAWTASGESISWCATDQVQVDGQTAAVESCDESVVGAPTGSTTWSAAIALGRVDPKQTWRWALRPFAEGSDGDVAVGLSVPVYVNLGEQPNMSEDSTRKIIKFMPTLSLPLGTTSVSPTLGVSVTLVGSSLLFDPTSTDL